MGFFRGVTNEDLRWYAELQRNFSDESDIRNFLKRTDQFGRYLFISGVIDGDRGIWEGYQGLMQEEQGASKRSLLEQVLNLD